MTDTDVDALVVSDIVNISVGRKVEHKGKELTVYKIGPRFYRPAPGCYMAYLVDGWGVGRAAVPIDIYVKLEWA